MTGVLKDIPTEPRWIINATTYESGKNWRFMPQRMGDYRLGYVLEPGIAIADAVAASAAFPGLIGPLILQPKDFDWHQYDGNKLVTCHAPSFRRLHLWDGGVYDNLGVEALFKPRGLGNNFRSDINFLIVSDASAELPHAPAILIQRPRRLIEIAVDQVRSLRARMLAEQFSQKPNTGVYLRLGRSATYLLRRVRLRRRRHCYDQGGMSRRR